MATKATGTFGNLTKAFTRIQLNVSMDLRNYGALESPGIEQDNLNQVCD